MTGPPGRGVPRVPAGEGGDCVVMRLSPPAMRTGLRMRWLIGLWR